MKKSSIPLTILKILWEVGAITVDAFFNPVYARRYGYTPTNFSRGSKAAYYNWNKATSRLKNKNLIRQKGDIYYLTTRGEKEAFLCYLKDRTLKFPQNSNKNQKWDGKWRILFFDIPEKKRRYRDELRLLLKAIGFREFQKSVWIYPYQVPSFLKEILFEEEIKHFTRMITTTSIEYDKDLKRLFKIN